jgi:hypothetical protein
MFKVVHFQRARQFMRLGKFVIEYYEALELINKETTDEFGRLISIILHAIFSFYWALDNISLAASFGIINIPEFEVSQSAMTIKFFGMALAAFYNLRTWMRLHYEELKARKLLKSLHGEENLSKDRELMWLVFQQWKMFLLCLKIFGDMLPTIAKSAIAKRLLKIQVPRAAQAIGGLSNAFVSCLIASY